MSDDQHKIMLEIYNLFDRVHSNIIHAGAFAGVLGGAVVRIEVLDFLSEADDLCDQMENLFGEILTDEERGLIDETKAPAAETDGA